MSRVGGLSLHSLNIQRYEPESVVVLGYMLTQLRDERGGVFKKGISRWNNALPFWVVNIPVSEYSEAGIGFVCSGSSNTQIPEWIT